MSTDSELPTARPRRSPAHTRDGTHSASHIRFTAMQDAIEIIDSLVRLDPFTKGAIERVLAAELSFDKQSKASDHYRARLAAGPFDVVRLREPRAGAETTKHISELAVLDLTRR